MSIEPGDDLLEQRAELRLAVERVLARLTAGELPSAVERAAVDLKEEAGRRGRGGVLLPSQPRNQAAAEHLADEVACLANSAGGGALVVGVEDATGDLLGTRLDVEWLRHRVRERVDVAPAIEERQVRGVRLLVVLVAEARTPVEDRRGRLRWRVGQHCVDVDRSEWWVQQQTRRVQDPLAAPSGRALPAVQPAALVAVARLLGQVDPLLAAAPAREQLTRLGALRPDERLSRAAALLLCPSGNPFFAVTVVDVEGGDVVVSAPRLRGLSLLEQVLAVEDRLDPVNQAVAVRSGLAEASVRSLPPAAVREALCNAAVHRDWTTLDPVEISWVQADAAMTVSSPGGFVGGVTPGNALTTRYARSPALADLFQALGLVEKGGLGVDRMVREMVSLGHRPPRLREEPGPRVRLRLAGGAPVLPVLSLVRRLQPSVRRRDTGVALVVATLMREPYVQPDLLVPVLQRDQDEVEEVLVAAEDCRVDDAPLVRRFKDVRVLGDEAVRVLEQARRAPGARPYDLLPYRRPSSSIEVVARWLRDHEAVTSGDVARLTGLSPGGALRQLERLEQEDVLDRGAARGRYAHFVPGPAFRAAPPPAPLLSG